MSHALALFADLGAAAAAAEQAGPLAAASRARLARIHSPRRLAQSALARHLAALAAARLLGRDYRADRLEEAEDGVRLGSAAPGVGVSLAHSGERVAVVVGGAAVGIDVERCDARRDCLALSRHALSAVEADWVARAPDGEHHARFYLLWTLREAAFKAGLRADTQGGDPCLDLPSLAARFCWASREVDGFRLTVASPSPVTIDWLRLSGPDCVALGEGGQERLGLAGALRID